jgi:ubiquinone/menaquinone biosynthesis C-methylase UbiE
LEEDERQVAEWYNTLSSSYDELYGREQSRKYQAVLEFLGDRRFKVLVDVGCGTGAFLKQAEKIYDRAIGIDLSIKMLRIATKRKTPNSDYVLASSSWLPLRDESSDGIVSISTAKAESNFRMFIDSLERIGHKDSLLAFTFFHEPGQPVTETIPRSARSTKVSERETLFFLDRTTIRRDCGFSIGLRGL